MNASTATDSRMTSLAGLRRNNQGSPIFVQTPGTNRGTRVFVCDAGRDGITLSSPIGQSSDGARAADRDWSGDERVRIVLQGLSGKRSIHEMCRREGLSPRLYYKWCLEFLEAGKDGVRGKDFNMRWVASMVADVFRVLSRGGIFMYPRDAKNKEGRLRLMYEANPMSFIVEQAGGAATEGTTRILDLQPKGLHQRCAVILGSKNEVERVSAYHRK